MKFSSPSHRNHRQLLRAASSLAVLLGAGFLLIHGGQTGPTRDARDRSIGYPRGPWWRADVNQTLLGVAHILFAHRLSAHQAVLLQVPKREPSARAPGDALAVAQRTLSELRADPSRFEALARKLSDDAMTAPLGGVIGWTFAPQLPMEMVDALGNLEPGEISRVVETPLGYHIIKRLVVPAPRLVAGQHIVIGHRNGFPMTRDGRPPTRSRDEALAIARRLVGEARQPGADFSQLVQARSDDFDAVEDGQYGPVSTHARVQESTFLFVLASLKQGEISDAIDTPSGFQILKRTALPDPVRVTATLFAVALDSTHTEAGITRDEAAASSLAASIRSTFSRDPSRFDALRNEHCDFMLCKYSNTPLQRGSSGYPGLVDRLRQVAIGEIVGPVRVSYAYLFARREQDAEQPAELPAQLDLPRPGPLDLSNATREQLVAYVQHLRDTGKRRLELKPNEVELFDGIFDDLARAYQHGADEQRQSVSADASKELASLLGPKRNATLTRLHEQLLVELNGRLER